MGTLAAARGPDICGIGVVMYLDHSIGGNSIIGKQVDGLRAPSFRNEVIVNPTLILEIHGGGPFVVAFAAIKEDLGLSTILSSM